MKKVTVSVITIAAFVVYALISHRSQSQAVAVTTGTSKTQNISPTQVISDQPSPTTISSVLPTAATPTIPTTPTTPTTAPTAAIASQQYKDGSYTGSAADAFYGNIQVKAIISGGKITDVQFLQSPNDQHESIEINSEAMPVLTQEAIQAQSANVDVVSRATDSSEAFKQSLATALAQAK